MGKNIDSIIIELSQIHKLKRSISPKLSLYKTLEEREKELSNLLLELRSGKQKR